MFSNTHPSDYLHENSSVTQLEKKGVKCIRHPQTCTKSSSRSPYSQILMFGSSSTSPYFQILILGFEKLVISLIHVRYFQILTFGSKNLLITLIHVQKLANLDFSAQILLISLIQTLIIGSANSHLVPNAITFWFHDRLALSSTHAQSLTGCRLLQHYI